MWFDSKLHKQLQSNISNKSLCRSGRLATLHTSFRVYKKMEIDMWFSNDDSSEDKILKKMEDESMVTYTMVFFCTNTCEFSILVR